MFPSPGAQDRSGAVPNVGRGASRAGNEAWEWALGATLCAVAAYMVGHFLWTRRDLFGVFPSLFGLYEINGEIVRGWELTGLGGVALGLAIGFLLLARLLLDRQAGMGLRALLFILSFAAALIFLPALRRFGVAAPRFEAADIAWAVGWVTAATLAALALGYYWEKVAPLWVIYGLVFFAGLAALGVVQPQRWDPVFWTTLGWIAVCGLVGWLVLSFWDTYLPPRAHLCVAFVIGVTVMSIETELLAMAHLFHRWPLVVAAALSILAAWGIAQLRARRPFPGDEETPSADARAWYRRLAIERYERSVVRADGWGERSLVRAAHSLTALITALTFYHGMAYAETYWDSLILYLGYARMTFLEGAFPFKAVAQVGIGLGANYPHLYPTFAATGPALAGEWSALGGQMAAPLAGLLSCVLAYHIVLRLTLNETFAALGALAFRAVPLGMAYFIYATDYSFAMLFALAFVYLAILSIETGAPGYLAALTLVCAGASHINYLMLVFWGLWALVVVLTHTRRARSEALRELGGADPFDIPAGRPRVVLRDSREDTIEEGEILVEAPLEWAEDYPRARLRDLARSRAFWTLLAAGLLLAAPWYVRNTVLTGNPVYAFFPEWFGGVRINPFVLESCRREWMRNGAGIARVADIVGKAYGELTVWDKVRGLPWFFFSYVQSWRWQPFFLGWVVPGALVALGGLGWRIRGRAKGGADSGRGHWLAWGDTDRVGLLALAMLGGFLLYHVAVADFYLYQILPALAVWPVFMARVFEATRARPWRWLMAACILIAGVCPGVCMSMMGFKIFSAQVGGTVYPPTALIPLRRPGVPAPVVWHWRYGADAVMVEAVNELCYGRRILTHENRHLMFDPSITLVHLDDWEVQRLWGRPPEAILVGLERLGVSHYLRVPNEASHPINGRLGMDRLIDEGRLRRVAAWGENELYVLPWADERNSR